MLQYLKENLKIKSNKNAIDYLKNLYNLNVNSNILKNSLNELGFGSLQVAELAFFIEDCLEKKYNSSSLIATLLDTKTTLQHLIELLEKAFQSNYLFTNLEVEAVSEILIEDNLDAFLLTKNWSENMGSCVDATPLINNGYNFIFIV